MVPRLLDATRSTTLRTTITSIFFLAIAIATVWSVHGNWNSLSHGLAQLTWRSALLSLAASITGVMCSYRSWRLLLLGLGSQPESRAAQEMFYLGQMGKYLPGSIWVGLVQVTIGKRHQIPSKNSAAAFLLSLLVAVATGGLISLGFLPTLGGSPNEKLLIASSGAALILLGSLPWLLPHLSKQVPPRLRTWVPPQWPARSILLRSSAWVVGTWIAYGTQLYILATALDISGPHLFGRSLAAMTTSFVLGIAVVIAPAGAGVREAALIALLSPSGSTTLAATAAISSRIFLTASEAILAIYAVALRRLTQTKSQGNFTAKHKDLAN